MALNDLQKSFKSDASAIKDYELLSKTELANGYCDADEALSKAEIEGNKTEIMKQRMLRSAYFSAITLRYWYKIFEWMNNSSSLLVQPEEYVDWLTESLSIAFRYRVWRTPYKMTWGKHSHKITGFALDEHGDKMPNPYYYITDPNAPDKIFNRCIFSARGRAYQFANKQKRKDGVHTYSLDGMVEDTGDFATVTANAFIEDRPITTPTSELIKELLDRGEVTEALIADGIAYHDVFKDVKKSDRTAGEPSTQFDTRRLVKHLNAIDDKYIEQFFNIYYKNKNIPVESVNKFKKMNNTRLYKCIDKTLQEIKQTPALLNCLVN